MIEQSSIFNKKQLEVINKRIAGDYSDRDGTFAKIRPKLKEMYIRLPTPSQLKKLLKQKRKRDREDIPEKKKRIKAISLEEFRKEKGW